MKKKWIRDALLFGIQTKTWKIMRLNAIFLFLCLSQAWAISGYSQATRLTLKMSDSKIIEVLDEIEEQSEFYFLFNQKLVDVERKVDIDVQEKPIDFILQNLFAGTNVSHMVIDRQIVLTTFNRSCCPSSNPPFPAP
jgi:TonB-dependent starch-binding outer membrane protein SusC